MLFFDKIKTSGILVRFERILHKIIFIAYTFLFPRASYSNFMHCFLHLSNTSQKNLSQPTLKCKDFHFQK